MTTTQPAALPESATVLPDGSAFAIASFPLPADHWLYAPREYRDGEDDPIELPAPILSHRDHGDAVRAAIRYAVRSATMCGKEEDFDPDALVQNAMYALCGPFGAATLQAQAQPAAVSDAEIDAVTLEQWGQDAIRAAHRQYARAILALRPQAESEAPTIEAAHQMGAKGGPAVEAERLAFEAWMAGHCWKVSPTWNGQTYDDSEEDKKRKLLDPLARTTRMLWAAWRDRAALNTRPQAVPMTEQWRLLNSGDQIQAGDECLQDDCVTWLPLAGWEVGMTYNPHVLVPMRRRAESHHGITAPAGGEG